MDQVRSWGGIPVQIAPGDTYMALERGLGDVFFGPLPTGVAYGLLKLERVKDVTVLPATTVFLAFVVNHDVWNSLSDKDRALMEKSAAGRSVEAGRLLYQRTNEDMEAMRKAGCSVHVLDAVQFQAFKAANSTLLANWWVSKLEKLGVSDAKAFLRLAQDMAGETPGRGKGAGRHIGPRTGHTPSGATFSAAAVSAAGRQHGVRTWTSYNLSHRRHRLQS